MRLDPVLKDSDGIPAPRIDYRIGENTARMMEHARGERRGVSDRDGCETADERPAPLKAYVLSAGGRSTLGG
jgi:hypothetical protein